MFPDCRLWREANGHTGLGRPATDHANGCVLEPRRLLQADIPWWDSAALRGGGGQNTTMPDMRPSTASRSVDRRTLIEGLATVAVGITAGCLGSNPDRSSTREAGSLLIKNNYDSDVNLNVQVTGEGTSSSRSIWVASDGSVKHQLVDRQGSYTVRIERRGTLITSTRIDVVRATEQRGDSPYNGDYLTIIIQPDQGITVRMNTEDP